MIHTKTKTREAENFDGVQTPRAWYSLALNRIILTLELEHLLLHPVFTRCVSSAFAAWQILSDCVLIDWGIGFLFLCFGFLNHRWRKYFQSCGFIGWSFGAAFWFEEREGTGVCLKDVFSWQMNCVCVFIGVASEWRSCWRLLLEWGPPHSWFWLVLRQSDSKNYLKMCSFCTYLKNDTHVRWGSFERLFLTCFSFRKTFDSCFILSYFIEDLGRMFHNNRVPDWALLSGKLDKQVIWKFFCLFVSKDLLN